MARTVRESPAEAAMRAPGRPGAPSSSSRRRGLPITRSQLHAPSGSLGRPLRSWTSTPRPATMPASSASSPSWSTRTAGRCTKGPRVGAARGPLRIGRRAHPLKTPSERRRGGVAAQRPASAEGARSEPQASGARPAAHADPDKTCRAWRRRAGGWPPLPAWDGCDGRQATDRGLARELAQPALGELAHPLPRETEMLSDGGVAHRLLAADPESPREDLALAVRELAERPRERGAELLAADSLGRILHTLVREGALE